MQARREEVQGKDGANAQKTTNNKDVVKEAINNSNIQKTQNVQNAPQTMGQKIRSAEEEYAKAQTDFKSAALATLMSPANVAAGLGLGIGLDDDPIDILTKGSIITKGLDWTAEKVGAKAADKDRKTFYEHEKKDGEKYGYTPSEKIIREKTVVEQKIQDAADKKLYLDPIAVGKEIRKQLEGVGDIFANQMKKELSHIDRNLDDSQ